MLLLQRRNRLTTEHLVQNVQQLDMPFRTFSVWAFFALAYHMDRPLQGLYRFLGMPWLPRLKLATTPWAGL